MYIYKSPVIRFYIYNNIFLISYNRTLITIINIHRVYIHTLMLMNIYTIFIIYVSNKYFLTFLYVFLFYKNFIVLIYF